MNSTPKILTLALFTNIDPHAITVYDAPLKSLKECSRHQIVIACNPNPPAAGSVAVTGSSYGSQMVPANFDSRLDSIVLTTKGAQIFTFYGLFDYLHFVFSSFPTGCKLSAFLTSHQDELLISGNSP